MKRMKLLIAALAAISFVTNPHQAVSQSSNPFNPDFAWCATPGAIAVRNQTPPLWGCLPPGTAGQVLRTNGPGANASWQTITGTGTVTSVGLSLPSFITVTGSPVTTTGTLTGTLASQTANTFFAAPNGSAGAPTFRAIADADLPFATTTTRGAVISSAAVANQFVTGITTGTGVITRAQPAFSNLSGNATVAQGGTGVTSASGTALDNITGFAGTGIVRRTGAGIYTQGTTVSVAEGGTGQTTGNGTSLDNISGMAGTGIVRRTGAGTYTQGTTVSTAEIADASVTTAKLATPAASGASEVLIASSTVTAATEMLLTGVFSSTYDYYRIVLVNFSVSSDAALRAQYGNGGTYITTATYGSALACRDTANADVSDGGNGDTFIDIVTISNAGALIDGTISVFNPSGAGRKQILTETTFQNAAASQFVRCSGMGINSGTAVMTDLKLFSGIGTVTGTAYVYGIRKS